MVDEGADEGPALAAGPPATSPASRRGRSERRTATADPALPLSTLGPHQEGDRDDGGGGAHRQGQGPGARAGSRPSVLSATKIAPCVRNSSSVMSAAEQGVGVEQVEEPADVLAGPRRSGPRARCWRTPRPTAAPARSEPTMIARSQRPRQRSSSRLARYSKATPRTIRATQDQQQRQVEPAEQAWRTTRGTRRTSRRRRPAARPRCRPRRGRSVLIMTRRSRVVLGQDRQQHPDAEVEALEHEVADPQDGDQRRTRRW